MRVFLYFAILAVSQNAICKSIELFCFLKFFSIFSQKNSSKTGSEALICFGSRNLGRFIFPFLTLWAPVPEARVGIKNHGAFASWFKISYKWSGERCLNRSPLIGIWQAWRSPASLRAKALVITIGVWLPRNWPPQMPLLFHVRNSRLINIWI